MKKYILLLLGLFCSTILVNGQNNPTCTEIEEMSEKAFDERKKNIEQAERSINIAIGLLSDSCLKVKAKCYVIKGVILVKQEKFAEARDLYDEALEIREELKDIKGQASVHNNYSTLELNDGNIGKAIENAIIAIEKAEAIRDDELLAKSNNNLGNIYVEAEKYNEASEKYQLAIQHYEKLGEDYELDIADTYYNLGASSLREGKLGFARKCFDDSLEFSKEIGDLEAASEANNAIGNFYLEEEEYTLAIQSFEKSKTQANSINETKLEFDALLNIGIAHYNNNNLVESLNCAEQLNQLIDKDPTKWLDEKIEYRDLLADIYAKQGDYKNAYRQTEEIASIKVLREDQLEKEKFSEIYASVRSEAKIKRWIKNLLLAIACLFIVLLSYILWSWKDKKEAIENAWQMIGRELHEDVANNVRFIQSQIEGLNTKTNQKEFNGLSTDIENLYQKTRNLSHEVLEKKFWFIYLKRRIRHLNNRKDVSASLTEFRTDDIPQRIGTEIRKITMELLTNFEKYAIDKEKKTSIYVDITKRTNEVILIVEDEGKGFNKSIHPKGKGLNNITNRVKKLGGSFNIDSERGKGTWVTINIPIKNIHSRKKNYTTKIPKNTTKEYEYN